MKKILPPDVSDKQFNQALAAFREVVGDRWVFAEETDELVSYRDPYAIVDEAHFRPSASIAPDGVEEIRAILNVANDFNIPLWPVSCGKNLAYGGAAPRLPGSVVLDLKRMNRVLEVNEKFGYALVEPGVSFYDLYNHIQARGIKLWLDVPDPGWGSVVGTTLEGGPVIRLMATTSCASAAWR